jgi:plastocyanin
MTRVLGLVAALLVAALLGATDGAAVQAQNPKLFGSVGQGIVLRDAQGNRVTKLDPGTYDIEVDDQSDFHTFHLVGPGVDERTEVEFTGTVNWTVTLKDGNYIYYCDVHPVSLRGAFVAGNPPAQPPPPPPTSGAITAKTKLVLTAGPAQVITLKTSAGKRVKAMKLGTYTMVVRDRGRIHNAHVVAPGFNRKTSPLTFTGVQTWKVKLGKAGTLRFLCDPHSLVGMKGSAKIVP